MKICVLEGHNFGRWAVEHARGERPSSLPYGLERLTAHGVSVRHTDLTHSDRRIGRALRAKDSALPYRLRFNGALGQTLTSLPVLACTSVCLSIFEHHAGVYAAMRRGTRGRVLPPMLLMSCYLAQWLVSGSDAERQLARRIARSAQGITVFSSNQVDVLASEAGVEAEVITVIPYGVDTGFYRPAEGARCATFIAAVGRDEGRDWATFLAAAGATPEIRYKLATPKRMIRSLTLPPNVEFLGEIGHSDYRALLRDAAAVVVPTKDFAYPTGQSVMLEAMASGAPVIVPNTSAMSDYLTDASRTYSVGRPAALADAVRSLWRAPEQRAKMSTVARRLAAERFDTANMWEAAMPALRRLQTLR